MSPNIEMSDRRTVIKSTSALLGVLGLGGTASASGEDNDSNPSDDDIRSGGWGPDDDDIQLSSNTLSPTQTSDIDYNALTYIDSLEAGGPVYSDVEEIRLGYVDFFLHFYRGDEQDDNGNYLSNTRVFYQTVKPIHYL